MTHKDDLANPYYVRMMNGPVGAFGEYLMKRAFDPSMRSTWAALHGEPGGSEKFKLLVARLASLTPDERDAVGAVARDAVIEALHGLLHGLSHDTDRIKLLFDGHDVAAASDGLQGDLFWWLRDLSMYPSDSDVGG